jgi:hypothetical protein
MLLSQLRDYMRIKKQASQDEIAVALNVDASVLEQLVDYYHRKGMIVEQDVKNCQSPCVGCHCKTYIWIETSQSSVKL